MDWCDTRCKHGDFTNTEHLDGACRTYQYIWCKKLEKHVVKNSLCAVIYGSKNPYGKTKEISK